MPPSPRPLSWPVAGTLPPVTRPTHPKILATIFLSPCPPSSGIWMSLCHPVTHHPSPSIPATPAPNHRMSWPGLGPRLTKADTASPLLTSEADTKLMTRAGRKPHKPESQSLSDGADTHLGAGRTSEAVTPGSSPGEGVGEPWTEGGAQGMLQGELGSPKKTPETGELGRYRNRQWSPQQTVGAADGGASLPTSCLPTQAHRSPRCPKSHFS